MVDFISEVLIRTKRYEGFRHDVYIDTVGKATIGYGTNLDNEYISYGIQDLLFKCLRAHINSGGVIGNKWNGLFISQEQAENILRLDLKERWAELIEQFGFIRKLPLIARSVLLDMCYNLGQHRLSGFTRFIAALKVKDYPTAAKEMLDSRWAVQVKRRATEQADEIRGLVNEV